MKKPRRKKPVQVCFWKLKFWKQRLRKVKAVICFKKVLGFHARILAISAVSFLALVAIFYSEYSFWSGIRIPKEGREYFFSENNFRKAGETLKQTPLEDIKIAVVTDAHAGMEIGYSNLEKFMSEIAGEEPDLIINAGDLIESRIRYKRLSSKDVEKELTTALGILTKNYPLHSIIGNHEVLSLNKSDIKIFTGEDSYYSFNFKGYNFIILDANFTVNGKDIGLKNTVPGADKGFIPKEEKEWLEAELKNNRQNIIFVHHPLYNLKNSPELERILRTYSRKIIIVVNGHKHKAEIRKFGGVTNYDIPSLRYQRTYSIVEIYGINKKVSFDYF